VYEADLVEYHDDPFAFHLGKCIRMRMTRVPKRRRKKKFWKILNLIQIPPYSSHDEDYA